MLIFILSWNSHVCAVHSWESRGVAGPETRLGGGRGRFEGRGVLGYLRVHKVHSRNANLRYVEFHIKYAKQFTFL